MISPEDALKKYRTVAVVGASENSEKDAHTVPLYLKEHGYNIIPVNPKAKEIFGEKAYASLLDIPPETAKKIEMIDVFRPSEELPKVAEQAVEMKKRSGRPYVFWAQLGLESDEARRILEKNGIEAIMNACMRSTHQLRLRGRT